MQTNKIHWASLLTLIVLGLGASFLLLAALGVGINSVVILFSEEGDAAGQMISAFTFGFEGVVLLLCCWFVLQKTMGWEQADTLVSFNLEAWHIAAVVGLAIISIAIGAAVVVTEVGWLAWLILPALTVIVIVPPIWLLFSMGSKGVELGQRWRVFGIFGLSMTLGPLVMIIMEITLLVGGIILGVIFIAVSQPQLVQELGRLGLLLQSKTDEDAILNLLAPYLSNPALIAAAIGYIAVLVPLIEELFKPLAVWIFARKLTSPAQGFAMGLLSGAAFALVESLNASGAATDAWPVIVAVRCGTSLLHIMASGLVGWGITSAFLEKRIWRLVTAYLSAVLIHGVWNACAVGVGLSMMGEFIGKPEWLFTVLPAAAGGMFVLAVGIFWVLVASNKRIRNSLSLKNIQAA
jgi:hypothetical protein